MTRSASCTFALLSIVVAGCQAHIDDSATVVAVVAVGPEVERVGILIDDADEPAVSATVGRAKGGFSVSVRPGTSEGSKGSEVWVFDISTPQSRVTFTPSQFSNEPWLLRDDAAAPGGKVAIGNGTSPSVLNATVEGSRLTIRFLQHPWSGSAEVTVNGKRSTIDLYADPGNLKDVTFLAETIGEAVDEGNRRQTLKFVVPHPDSAVPKMTFRAEPAGKLRLESVLVNDRAAELVGEETALWPATSVWRAHKGALLFTVLAILCAAFALAAGSLWRYPLGESSARVLIAAWLAAAMCAVWWSAVSYPGYMTADSLDQWGQAMRGRFTTWHPPFMAMLMKATLVFVNQPIFFTVIQALLFWFSAFWAMSITVKNVRLRKSS